MQLKGQCGKKILAIIVEQEAALALPFSPIEQDVSSSMEVVWSFLQIQN